MNKFNRLTDNGSVIMGIIIAVTIAAGLGAAMHSVTSTATFTQLASMDSARAYLLSESGAEYAIKRIVETDSSDSTARTNLISELTANPFTLTDAGQFSLSINYSQSSGSHNYALTSVGTINTSISQTTTYLIKIPLETGAIEIPFDEDPNDDDDLNPDNWNVVGDIDLGDEKLTLNADGDDDTQVSLNWTDPDTSHPDLKYVWENDSSLLSYEVQVKIDLKSGEKDTMAGISFRLDTSGDNDFSNDAFYGLSYLWCKDDDEDLPGFCDGVDDDDNDKTFIVLWKQASDGTQTVLSKKLASSVDGDLVESDDGDDELKKWSTLIVRIQEQIMPGSGIRENFIYAYVADEDTYETGTIHWDYSDFTAVSWDTCNPNCSAQKVVTQLPNSNVYSESCTEDCFTGGGADCSCVHDHTYTTENFGTFTPDEIGLHALGDEESKVRDMAIRLNYDFGQVTSF